MIYRRGKQGIYWYRFRFAGRFVHESTRSRSKSVARTAERQRRREFEEKFNGIEKRKLPPTVTQASKAWIEKRVGLAEGTRETYEAALKHLRAKLGTMLVCDIAAQDVARYQDARSAESAAPATINKEIACLGSMLGDCGLWGRIRRDVKRLSENEDAGRALTLAEEAILLERTSLAGEHQGGWTPLHTVTVLGLNTGMRHKEIRTLRWKHVSLENRILRVSESKTKAGEGRAIPLTQPAWAALDFWASRFPKREPAHFVFPACENGQVRCDRPIANWRTAWRRATSLIQCPHAASYKNPLPCVRMRNVKWACRT
jgi:integrase